MLSADIFFAFATADKPVSILSAKASGNLFVPRSNLQVAAFFLWFRFMPNFAVKQNFTQWSD